MQYLAPHYMMYRLQNFMIGQRHILSLLNSNLFMNKKTDYWNLKAHNGGKASVIVGNVRDMEVMISDAKNPTPYYDIVLRTGAWGKGIVFPSVIPSALIAEIASVPVAAIENYRAHSYEKKFWEFITTNSSEIGK